MSEPMSSVEIEDVLSSIRRLVSDDLRPLARSRDPQPAPAAADKLMLTPALRIVPEPEAEPAKLAEAAPEPMPAPVDEVMFHTVRDVAAEEAGFVAVDDEADDPSPEAPLSRRAAFDVVEDDAYDDTGAAAPVAERETIPEDVFTAPQADAELASDWADQAEAAVRAELEQETTHAAFARFVDEPEELTFDDAAMRDLVRDIIREELQGTLGERITRNVRKLVRAEIARALAVRDFE